MEPLELAFTVACPPEHAFAVWTERTSLWWPKGHSVSADPELDGDVRAARRAAASSSARRPARSTTGARSSSGSRRAGSPTSGTCARTARTPRGWRSPSRPPREGTAVTIVHSGWERLGARATCASATSAAGAGCCRTSCAACTAGPARRRADLRPARPVGTGRRARLHGAHGETEDHRTAPPPPLPARLAEARRDAEGRDPAEMAARDLGPPRVPARLSRAGARERLPSLLARARPVGSPYPDFGDIRRPNAPRRYRRCVICSGERVTLAEHLRDQVRARAGADLLHRVAHVRADGVVGDVELGRDLRPGLAVARSAARSRARAATGRPARGRSRPSGGSSPPQRDVLSATNSTSRCPVATSVAPAHCTPMWLPSAQHQLRLAMEALGGERGRPLRGREERAADDEVPQVRADQRVARPAEQPQVAPGWHRRCAAPRRPAPSGSWTA